MAMSDMCARTEMPDIHDSTTASSESPSHRPASIAPEHLNNTGCKIKHLEDGGRRVYGALSISLWNTGSSLKLGRMYYTIYSI